LPASKGEIFSSQNLSLMDKRCLMKFFKAIGPVADAGADAGAEKAYE
jgi:RAB protein geranylgeranyltransferase component A